MNRMKWKKGRKKIWDRKHETRRRGERKRMNNAVIKKKTRGKVWVRDKKKSLGEHFGSESREQSELWSLSTCSSFILPPLSFLLSLHCPIHIPPPLLFTLPPSPPYPPSLACPSLAEKLASTAPALTAWGQRIWSQGREYCQNTFFNHQTKMWGPKKKQHTKISIVKTVSTGHTDYQTTWLFPLGSKKCNSNQRNMSGRGLWMTRPSDFWLLPQMKGTHTQFTDPLRSCLCMCVKK